VTIFTIAYSSYIWLQGLSWLSSSSYGSWIYNYGLCNQYISPLKLWVRVLLRRGVHDTTLYDKVCQRLATGLWISLGTLVSSTTKTDCHDIAEILLKVAIMLYHVHLAWARLEFTTLVVICTDCTDRSCKSNYHMMMMTTTIALVIICKNYKW
jgi:hypothetical protein